MKRTVLTLVLGAAAMTAPAQLVEVQSVTKVPVSGVEVNVPRISPDGTFAVVSSNADNSLYRIDLGTGVSSRLGAQGSALELAFSPDGSTIVYKTSVTRDNHLRYYSVRSYELESGYSRSLSKEARHCAGYTVSRSGVLSINEGGRFSARRINGEKTTLAGQAIVGINQGHLEVTVPGGKPFNLDPQGRGSYLWPSLSPDGTKIAYYLVNKGCFVCDLDGKNVRSLGYIHAPAWLGNDLVIGCQDYDDGTFITASAIVAADLSGTMQTLTDASVIGINPSASADAKAITFSTPAGELYVITLK